MAETARAHEEGSISVSPDCCDVGGLVQVTGYPGGIPLADIGRRAGLPVPGDGRCARVERGTVVYRIAPGTLLVRRDEDAALYAGLRAALVPGTAAVTDLGHARRAIVLSGALAGRLLSDATEVEMRAADFPVDAFAQTALHDANVLVHRDGNARYTLLAPGGFAESIRASLARAALRLSTTTRSHP